MIEYIIGGLIILVAIYIMYRNFSNKKAKVSSYGCSSCSSSCPKYNEHIRGIPSNTPSKKN